jgi:large subunit ribosomal protein L21
VHEGAIFDVATMAAEPGSRVELRDVLLVTNGDKVTVGSPLVPDALVVAEVIEHGKGRKVINFKYKAKVRYRRKRGHRQGFTRLAVQEIHLGKEVAKAPERNRSRAEAAPVEDEPEPIAAEAPEAAPEAEALATPTRRRRRTTESSSDT